jgi:hypothetical protein
VVWKASTELGVGWATGGNGWTYFCCNYAPAGNYRGDYEGNVLPPGTVCDEPEESNEVSFLIFIFMATPSFRNRDLSTKNIFLYFLGSARG